MEDQLTWKDATAQAELVRQGAASPLELVEAAIERIDRCNPALNAVIYRRFARAREEAAGPLPDGPFRGVPILFKDLGATQAGEPYCEGTAFARAAGYRADQDSYLVQRFRKAGFVVAWPDQYPRARDDDHDRAAGVRSDAQSLEHRALDGRVVGRLGGRGRRLGHGPRRARLSDGGGSIRVPASCCALFGLKPSRGRVSKGPAPGRGLVRVLRRPRRDRARFATRRPCLTRSPATTRVTRFVAPPPARPYAEEVGANPGRLRIGLLEQPAQIGFVRPIPSVRGRSGSPAGCSSRSVTGSRSPTPRRWRSPTTSATSSSSSRPRSPAPSRSLVRASRARDPSRGVRADANTSARHGSAGRSAAPDYLEFGALARGLQAPHRRLLVRGGLRPPLHAGPGAAARPPRRALRPGRGPNAGCSRRCNSPANST